MTVLISLIFLSGIGLAGGGINDGLAAHYLFNGNATDSSGTNNAVLFGSPAFDNGINGLAFSVSGDADYAAIPADTNINLNFDSKTISVWFYAGQQTHSQVELIDKTDSSDYDIDLLTNATPGVIELRFRAYDGGTACKISGLVPLKQWINAVVVKSGANISFYTNASLVGTTNLNSVTTKSNALYIGAGGSPYEAGYGFTGLIEDLRFYNRALATNEIQSLYFWSYPSLSVSPGSSPGSFQINWNAISGQAYQAQYNPDLSSTNWSNLGPALLATNGTMSASDTNVAAASQMYYRVVLLP